MEQLLNTKLHIPTLLPKTISRPRILARLNEGLVGRLTLISAPAGFGKTTLVRDWLATCERSAAWLSLDEGDSDLTRFLTYFIAALQTIAPEVGKSTWRTLQATPSLPGKSMLTALLNDLATMPQAFIFVLDDYHAVEGQAVDEALAFLLENLPPQMHLVLTTREDPSLPLARWRARGQLTELRANDLRFTVAEAATFLRQKMGLPLLEEEIATLEARTEGWIAGLQLAALSMRGHQGDMTEFIQAFTGSHRFVLDYLVEEVLHQQPENIQTFLLHTAILDRFCAPLCEALLETHPPTGQETLAYLEQANLFIISLDHERRWYRYHHLFAELLRQRLEQEGQKGISQLHVRASQWYEAQGLELEAFHHAAAANDVGRAERLIEGEGLPLYFRGEAIPVRHWLETLPDTEFKARPSLWVTYASVLTMTGRLHNNIEEILNAAETALQDTAPDDKTNDLLGQIAAIRAMLAVTKNQVDTILTQARRALALLHPGNAPMRTTTTWTLGYAYQVQGKRAAASQAYAETILQSQKSGNLMTEIAATTCLGQIQESKNQLHQAEETFQRILQIVGDPPWPAACEACVGLARIHYQWNDLEAAERYGQQGLTLARQLENVDTPAACGVLLARVKLARSDAAGALANLVEAEQFVQHHQFVHWNGEITDVRIQTLLHQGHLSTAAQFAEAHDLPLGQARVKLAQGDPIATLALLEPVRQQADAKAWGDEQLRVTGLQALAHHTAGNLEQAEETLARALKLAEPGGLIRPFVDEGPAMAALLREIAKHNPTPYLHKILAAFGDIPIHLVPNVQPLLEPLSERELEVLKLLKTDLSGPEIARELMVSLNTMRTHTKNIYSKLGVNNRRLAVHRAEDLGLA